VEEHAVILFAIYQFFIAIIMLNLIIALLADVYDEVNAAAKLDLLFTQLSKSKRLATH
jgi:hypothetical protein